MSCRSTAGGKAASGAATAITGVSADETSRIMHRLRRIYRDAGATGTATPDEVVRVMHGLAFHLRNRTGITDERRTQVIAKIENAIKVARDGSEPLPDGATLRSWHYLIAEVDAERAIAVQQERQQASRRKPYHKRFQNFNEKTLESTKELFASRPSRLTPEERDVVFRKWVDDVSEAYGMEPPTFRWDVDADHGGGGYYRPDDHSITMSPNHPSVVTLIHETRHALQVKEKGAPMVSADVEEDARAWSLSLYHQVKPVLFERLVREGRIFHITEADLD